MYLGQDYQDILRTTKNTDFEQVKTLFDISQNLAQYHKSDIFGITTIEWNTIPRMRTPSLHGRAIKLSKTKVHVYNDSVPFSWKDSRTSSVDTALETWILMTIVD